MSIKESLAYCLCFIFTKTHNNNKITLLKKQTFAKILRKKIEYFFYNILIVIIIIFIFFSFALFI